jgi:peptidyl-prolyl cis-trans isomerase D
MMRWLRKHNKEILLFTFATFILGGVVFTGAQGFGVTSQSPVLVVNGEKIPYSRYQARYQQAVNRQDTPPAPDKVGALKASTLQDLVQETAFLQEADRYGIQATDGEVAAFIQSVPAFQRNGAFDQNLYLSYVIQQLRSTPEAFEEDRRRDVRRQKLLMLLSGAIKVSDGEAQAFLKTNGAALPAKDAKELAADPVKLRNAAGQEQGNAVFQAWIQQVNGRLKVENHLDRWGKKEG